MGRISDEGLRADRISGVSSKPFASSRYLVSQGSGPHKTDIDVGNAVVCIPICSKTEAGCCM